MSRFLYHTKDHLISSLVFWEEEWLVGRPLLYVKFWIQRLPLERNRRFWTDKNWQLLHFWESFPLFKINNDVTHYHKHTERQRTYTIRRLTQTEVAQLDWACRAAWRLGSGLCSYWRAIHHKRQLQQLPTSTASDNSRLDGRDRTEMPGRW